MNYDLTLIQIMDSLKADKTIPAEYRNAVISSARRLQLEIRGAKTMTYQTSVPAHPGQYDVPSGKVIVPDPATSDPTKCICPVGGIKRSCEVHGEGV